MGHDTVAEEIHQREQLQEDIKHAEDKTTKQQTKGLTSYADKDNLCYRPSYTGANTNFLATTIFTS